MGPEDAKRMIRELEKKVENVVVVKPGEQKALRRTHCGLPVFKGGLIKKRGF